MGIDANRNPCFLHNINIVTVIHQNDRFLPGEGVFLQYFFDETALPLWFGEGTVYFARQILVVDANLNAIAFVCRQSCSQVLHKQVRHAAADQNNVITVVPQYLNRFFRMIYQRNIPVNLFGLFKGNAFKAGVCRREYLFNG
jgi:hypothetical protein